MRPPSIPPTVTETTGPVAGQEKNHPAFGQIHFSRVSGDPGKLYGSEINHNGFVRLTIHPSKELWHLSQSWYHGSLKTLCEVDLSAAQFAELLTSMNVGMGVPCTLRYVEGLGEIPYIEDDKNTLHEQIKSDIRKEATEAFKGAAALEKLLDETLAKSKLSKIQKEEISSLARKLTNAVRDSMPFIVDQYQEAAEKVGAKAKAELDAFAMSIITRLGEKALAQLNEETPKVQLKG